MFASRTWQISFHIAPKGAIFHNFRRKIISHSAQAEYITKKRDNPILSQNEKISFVIFARNLYPGCLIETAPLRTVDFFVPKVKNTFKSC